MLNVFKKEERIYLLEIINSKNPKVTPLLKSFNDGHIELELFQKELGLLYAYETNISK